MDCEQVRAKLSAYLDGELPAGQAAELSAHLAQCTDCTAQLDALRRADRIAADSLEERPPEGYFNDFADRVAARIADHDEDTQFSEQEVELPWAVRWERHVPFERRAVKWLSAAAAVLAAVLLACYALGPGRQGPPGTPGAGYGTLVAIDDELAAPSPELGTLLVGSEVVLTRLVNGGVQELPALAGQVQQIDLLNQIASEQDRSNEPEVQVHLERLEVIMLRIVNTDPNIEPDEALALQQDVNAAALLEANDAIRARVAPAATGLRRLEQ